MSSFDINGAIINFDKKMDNYNKIRRIFKEIAEKSQIEFEEYCTTNLNTLLRVSEKGLIVGQELIDNAIKKCIENIIDFGILTIDIEIFKDTYANKYLNYDRVYNNINKEILLSSKNKKSSNSKHNSIDVTINKLSKCIYDDCFNLHYAIIESLLSNNVEDVGRPIEDENIKKANALFNNYKDGLISTIDECRVVEKIINLNPYREDLYEYLIKEDGDVCREIDRFTNYIGYDLSQYKSDLVDNYINKIVEENLGDIESSKDKVLKYAKYLGCKDTGVYVTRIDAIFTFEHA